MISVQDFPTPGYVSRENYSERDAYSTVTIKASKTLGERVEDTLAFFEQLEQERRQGVSVKFDARAAAVRSYQIPFRHEALADQVNETLAFYVRLDQERAARIGMAS